MLATLALLLPLQHPAMGAMSVYDMPADVWAGKPGYACKRRLIAKLGRRGWLLALQTGVAHRELPCGARLRLCRLDGRCATAVVVDRGSYGQVPLWCSVPTGLAGRCPWRWGLKLKRGWRWRGAADVRYPLARRIGLSGVELMLAVKL